MNWLPEWSAAARAEGWDVVEVFDAVPPHRYTVVVLAVGDTFRHKRAAQVHVIERAQAGSALHLTALRLMAASAAPAAREDT